MMRVLVCGGRDWRDKEAVFRTLDDLDDVSPIDVIIEGGQRTLGESGEIVGGADYFAAMWAAVRGRAEVTRQADWERHGRAAGPIRNGEMLRLDKPDLVIAFPGGKGTADMARRARAAGIEVREIT